MYFSTFSKYEKTEPIAFLNCPHPNHESYFLDSVCIDENCKEKNRLICALCQYETHKKHKIQPLEVFIKKYKEMLQKENGKGSEALDLCIDNIVQLYGQTFKKLDTLMKEFQEHFSNTLLELNKIYKTKMEKIHELIQEENELIQLNSLRNLEFCDASHNISGLYDKIIISEDEFRLKNSRKSPEEISKLISSIKNLQIYLQNNLEKNFEAFKKSLQLSLNKFNDKEKEGKKEKEYDKEKLLINSNGSILNKNPNADIFFSQMGVLNIKAYDHIKFDFAKGENELLFGNQQFNNVLAILKQDFMLMVESLEKLHDSSSEYKKEHYNTKKKDFSLDYDNRYILPKKDLISWN